MKKFYFVFLFLIFSVTLVFSQNYKVDKSSFIYKEIKGVSLEMTMYKPQVSSNTKLPAVIFFFVGGWVGDSPAQFELLAEYLATRGIVAFCADYRTKSRHSTTPFESVMDAKSAVRYLKSHGNELGIDTGRIVASGGSAGGHLAACTAVIKNVNEASDDLSVSSVPKVLV